MTPLAPPGQGTVLPSANGPCAPARWCNQRPPEMPWPGPKLLVMNVTLGELTETMGASAIARASAFWPSPLATTSA